MVGGDHASSLKLARGLLGHHCQLGPAAEQRKVRWPELLRIRRGHEIEESLFLGLAQARGRSQALVSGAEGHDVSGFEGFAPCSGHEETDLI